MFDADFSVGTTATSPKAGLGDREGNAAQSAAGMESIANARAAFIVDVCSLLFLRETGLFAMLPSSFELLYFL